MNTRPVKNCETCFEAVLNACTGLIIIEGGFAPGMDYTVTITGKFGNEYRLNLTADAAGNLTIGTAALPEGLFTSHSGVFTLRVLNAEGCAPAVMNLCGEFYTCVKFSFKPVLRPETEEEPVARIGCCTGAASGTILFNTITFTCHNAPSTQATVRGRFTAPGGSGSYSLQVFEDGAWRTVEENMDPVFSFTIQSGPESEGDFLVRVIDNATGAFSNSLTLHGQNCNPGETPQSPGFSGQPSGSVTPPPPFAHKKPAP